MLLDLLYNISLLVALSALLPLVARRWGLKSLTTRLVFGGLFGAVALTGMLTPVEAGNGVIFDGRSVVLCAAGVFGGPLVAGVAAFIAAGYRAYLGGAGVYVGLAVIVESAALGSGAYYLRHRPGPVLPRHLLELGLLVHVVMVGLLLTLPGGLATPGMAEIAIVTLTVYPVATAVVCWLLLEEEERIATRGALARSEAQLKLAIDGSHTGLWDWGIKADTIEVNPIWTELIGLSPEELAHLTVQQWVALIHPEDLPTTREALTQHFLGLTPFYTAEFRMHHADGRWVWLVARGSVVERDSEGSPVRMTGSHNDISTQKAAEAELKDSRDKMEQMVLDVAEVMGRVVEVRDPYTQGHEQRVSILARQIAERMGMGEDEADAVEMAGLLHDVGKLHIPSEILTKPGELSAAEFALIREHPQHGHDILKDISFPWPIAEVVLQHHERLDGTGYPSGLEGDRILVASRILAVADVVEAMASHRPYRPALGLESAISEVRDHPAKYDQSVVAACLELHEAGLIDL